MTKQSIEPHRVTKPIQLLAAWLTGLVLVDGGFLTAARFITNPEWVSIVLVIAAVANVPLFLICIFILQTRFRPEMREDALYSKYLQRRQTIKEKEQERIAALKSELRTKTTELDELQRSIQQGKQSGSPNLALELVGQLKQQRGELESRITNLQNQIEQIQTAQ